MPPLPARALHASARIAFAGLLALAALTVLWELVLAPARPGGTWLALKGVPLALLLPGIARGARRVRQVAALIVPWYAAEGIVRAITEAGRHALVAGMSAALALVTFVALLVWLRSNVA